MGLINRTYGEHKEGTQCLCQNRGDGRPDDGCDECCETPPQSTGRVEDLTFGQIAFAINMLAKECSDLKARIKVLEATSNKMG